MSLYRPIPQLQLAANVDQALSPRSLRDYGKLLYWIFFFPQAVVDYWAATGNSTTPTDTGANPAGNVASLGTSDAHVRQTALVQMSAILLLALTVTLAILTGLTQMLLLNLNRNAAFNSGLGAVPLGLLAGLIFRYTYWQQPAKGVVLGVASGVTVTAISMCLLGEVVDSKFLNMLSALVYGFIGGSGVGIIGNLATTLDGKAQASTVRSVAGAAMSGFLIFLINGITYSERSFNFHFSQENLLAALSGALAFYGGAHVGQRRPLDWLLGKIRLNFQLHNRQWHEASRPYLQGTSIFTHYAPGLEALFAPTNGTQSDEQLHFPHVTLFPIHQLPLHLQTWLDYDWEAGLANAAQLWRYTNQHPLVIDGIHQVLEEADGAKQVEKVAQFVNKLDDKYWPLILYPESNQAGTATGAKQEMQKSKLSPHRAQTYAQRQQRYRHLLRQALTPQTVNAPRNWPLETPAQQAIAGFWHLKHTFLEESIYAFQQLPDDALSKELQGITQCLPKLLHTKNLVSSPTVELPARPKEPKRKATWDALEKFKPVVRYGWLYHQCKNEERRAAVVGVATHQLDEIAKDAEKIPQAERTMIVKLTERWRQEFHQWTAATRAPQRMKPENPFIFLEPLRGRPPFVGRDGELKALKQAGSRGSLQPVLLSGLVHSGKSSLIHKAMFEYKDEIVFAPFTIPDPGTGVLSTKQVLWAMYQQLLRRLQQQPLPELIFELNPESITEETVRRICARFKTTLVIVVNNVERLCAATPKLALQGLTIGGSTSSAEALFAFWWKLAASVGNLSFVFVSHAPDLPNTPFTPDLKKVQIGHLGIKEVLKLLMTPTPEFIPLFAPETVDYIYTLTGGQPFLVQLIAHCVVDRFNQTLDKDEKREPVFLIQDVESVLDTEAFRQFSQPYFRTLLRQIETLYPGKMNVLRAIAQHADGVNAATIERTLTAQYQWAEIELLLEFFQSQQIIKVEKGQWQVVGELLRRELV